MLANGVEESATVRHAIDTVLRLNRAEVHDSNSPLWYRGNAGCSAPIESDRLQAAFNSLGAGRVVIGHTPTIRHRVLQRFDGRVVLIDTGMLTASYNGRGSALIIEGDRLTTVYENEADTGEPLPHPRRVGIRPGDMTADQIAAALRSAAITATEELDDGGRVLTLSAEPGPLQGVFVANKGCGKGVCPAVAAYRLDRMLALDMVPVTVVREVEGKAGSLQFLPAATQSETERSSRRLGGSSWCPLGDQFDSMYVFDTLGHNPGRHTDSMLYSRDNYQLMLVDNTAMFGTSGSRPAYLQDVALKVGDYWTGSLQLLTAATLNEQLGDVLDKRRVKALLKRRDRILSGN